MDFDWNDEKNERLKQEREISFEMVEDAIKNGVLYQITDHPNQAKYPKQQIMYIEIKGYFHSVPFIKQADGTCFLKTIYRSRKANKVLQQGEKI